MRSDPLRDSDGRSFRPATADVTDTSRKSSSSEPGRRWFSGGGRGSQHSFRRTFVRWWLKWDDFGPQQTLFSEPWTVERTQRRSRASKHQVSAGEICERLVLLLANVLQHLCAGPSQLLDSDGWQKIFCSFCVSPTAEQQMMGSNRAKTLNETKPAFLDLPHKHTADLRAEECGLFLTRSENTSQSDPDTGILHD